MEAVTLGHMSHFNTRTGKLNISQSDLLLSKYCWCFIVEVLFLWKWRYHFHVPNTAYLVDFDLKTRNCIAVSSVEMFYKHLTV